MLTSHLKRIEFVTGSLLDAPDMGEFDYIDCCGVLHHLPDPQAGFDALAKAVTPDGGIGLMVYAPYGRSGVYTLQNAFNDLLGDLDPQARLQAASQIYNRLHLLLHSTDQPFTISHLLDTLDAAGLEMTGTPHGLQYDLSRFVSPIPDGMDARKQMQLAEQLDGTIKHHVIYARRTDGTAPGQATGQNTDRPYLRGVTAPALAQQVAKKQEISLNLFNTPYKVPVPREAAPIIAAMDGRKTLDDIRKSVDPILWPKRWPGLEKELLRFGMMVYTSILR